MFFGYDPNWQVVCQGLFLGMTFGLGSSIVLITIYKQWWLIVYPVVWIALGIAALMLS